MPPTTAELVAYCDQRTRRSAFVDAAAAHNGLQVANSGKVTRIGAAVDAGLIPFQKAAAAGVDFLLVHHGMYWDMPRPLVGPVYERVATLIRADCALYSSHLPLDAHPEIGNNALIARQLGLAPERGFAPNPGGDIGLICRNSRPREELEARLREHYPRVTAICYGSEQPSEVALCSGSGNSALRELAGSHVDTLITGELREEHFNLAQESRLNLYLCGHYATETHGVRALAAELADKFSLPWEFISTENPL
ncbi:dinuclear metal center protein, YbgI/SA1388 family [Cephaloticoccus primus]|uniref:Dinuclear metal center protein, YbgI/SA1388 family n=1 Tax=Cephaloticoccus primus TaxID=1548207 RepID=A0A139SLM5_9BACT|nr:Nif3-like dinuclear metal center hexameric protein [Cephaloticoccus primus]KXU35459.1 dinuclear metal center protein, YbgI/SA1388 family [Cephaloticoccus primus]